LTKIQGLSRICLFSRTFKALKIWKKIQGLPRQEPCSLKSRLV